MDLSTFSEAELQYRIDTLLKADDSGRDYWYSYNSDPAVFSYRFETSRTSDFPWDHVGNIGSYTEAEKLSVRAALNEFENNINVIFVEDNSQSDAVLSFYKTDDLYTGSPETGGGMGGGYHTENDWDGWTIIHESYDLTDPYLFPLLLHEIGHALGLKHPGNYDDGDHLPSGPFLPEGEDHKGLTLMSYRPDPCTSFLAMNLQEYDVLALQHFWGAPEGFTSGQNDAPTGPIEGTTGNDYIGGSEEADTISGHNGNDTIYGNCGDDIVSGSEGDDQLHGEAGNDVLYGGEGNDYILGNAGNDVIYGGAGNDFLRGGDGNDVLIANSGIGVGDDGSSAYYSASAESWDIKGGEEYAVLSGPGGERDKLIGIRYVQFGAENTVELENISALDGAGDPADFIVAERVALLYEAALNRNGAIDLPGLNFYIDVTERDNLSDEFLANDMMRSPEFAANFGDPDALSNAEFLERIYLNVLDRASDAAGRQFYLNLLNDDTITKSLALADIAISPENAAESTSILIGLYESRVGDWSIL